MRSGSPRNWISRAFSFLLFNALSGVALLSSDPLIGSQHMSADADGMVGHLLEPNGQVNIGPSIRARMMRKESNEKSASKHELGSRLLSTSSWSERFGSSAKEGSEEGADLGLSNAGKFMSREETIRQHILMQILRSDAKFEKFESRRSLSHAAKDELHNPKNFLEVERAVECSLETGQEVTINYSDPAWFWSNYCNWEPNVRDLFAREVQQGQTMLDIGAWCASTFILLGKLVVPSGRVVAVEPSSKAYHMAQKNIDLNPDVKTSVTLVHAAVGAISESTEITDGGGSQDRAGPFASKGVAVNKVRMLTVPDLRNENKLDCVDFVKIDIEGFENLLVPALSNFLSAQKPNIVLSLHPIYEDVTPEALKKVVDTLRNVYGDTNCHELPDELPEKLPLSDYERRRAEGDQGSKQAHSGTDIYCRGKPADA